MDHSFVHFNKTLSELTYEDISQFFQSPRAESDTLEFKSFISGRSTFDDGLRKAARGISSFLNANGGVLIWGAPPASKTTGSDKDVFMGLLAPVNEYCPKDTLINRINALISPLPVGLKVQILRKDGACVYVFEVQESLTKPHQFDYRYYIRLDGQSHPSPHYLVDAMIKKVVYPDIAGVIAFHDFQNGGGVNNGVELPVTIGLFNFSPFLNEEALSYRLRVKGGLFSRSRGMLTSLSKNPIYHSGGQVVTHQNFAEVLHFGEPKTYLETIAIDPQLLRKNRDMLQLQLSFGGKYSPAKTSTYTLDLSVYGVGLDANDRLTETEENVLFADKELTSREDQLSQFTKRT